MVRKLASEYIYIATHNPGKVVEFNALMSGLGVTARDIAGLGLEDPEETGATFHENAAIKAQAVAGIMDAPALADDSGLCVDALEGAPGIFSGRWAIAGPDAPRDFDYAMERVRIALADNGDTRARFVAVLCLAWPDGHCEYFEGEVVGRLVFPGRGDKGFGYDPIFLPDGSDKTFAQMSSEEKNALSHRTAAFRKLKDGVF